VTLCRLERQRSSHLILVQYSSFVGAGTQENFPDLATGGLRSPTTPTTTVRAAISRILLYSGSLGFGTRVELSCGPSDDGCSKRLTAGRFFACGRGVRLIFFARYPRPGTGVFNFRQIFSSITDEIPYDEIPYLVMARNRDQVAIRSAKIRGANGEQIRPLEGQSPHEGTCSHI